ncbi:hypothetical protein BDY21DRAFT_338711 [Lineolata rhizophorae]|uniref:Uncharacterized protein n=1 Tax=Lineolata rhizophorae TaxID=578093 RepID=A0A6A6P713_9PEZI|nr:hypothetical protein BDY21DRAFT_338711 [Lineolata rhizophorae]
MKAREPTPPGAITTTPLTQLVSPSNLANPASHVSAHPRHRGLAFCLSQQNQRKTNRYCSAESKKRRFARNRDRIW